LELQSCILFEGLSSKNWCRDNLLRIIRDLNEVANDWEVVEGLYKVI
jgi:hypothetical protein